MIRALFLCGTGRARGPTASQIFGGWDGVSADFAGIWDEADDQLGREQLDWATMIFVMEQRHARRLEDRFGRALRGKQVINLSIQDKYSFMQPELVEVLMEKAGPQLRQGTRR